MRIIKPSFTIENREAVNIDMLKRIEKAGRTCYKSEDKITEDSAVKFVSMVLDRQHESVIEHEKISVRFICDRGVTHEIVRHRLASYSQESTRYCNYSKDKFGKEITVIDPSDAFGWHEESDFYTRWWHACAEAENNYFALLDLGATPQQARSVLPNSLKTEILMTANLRELRHILKLRAVNSAAHPQIREIFTPLMYELNTLIPVIFKDLVYEYEKNKGII